VDTRTKILSLEQTLALRLAAPMLVTGYFDCLRAAHVCELESLRQRAGSRALVAAVLPWPEAFLSQQARAEMVAALRMVDYVVAIEASDVAALIDAVAPSEIVRLEAGDARRNRELIEHVHRRHSS
jgi:bifunctional ADP-heptose synthase (sugar kinase/adenylyltransferase)